MDVGFGVSAHGKAGEVKTGLLVLMGAAVFFSVAWNLFQSLAAGIPK